MILANVRSRMTPRGEAKRNLRVFLSGAALIAVGLAYAVIILGSLGT